MANNRTPFDPAERGVAYIPRSSWLAHGRTDLRRRRVRVAPVPSRAWDKEVAVDDTGWRVVCPSLTGSPPTVSDRGTVTRCADRGVASVLARLACPGAQPAQLHCDGPADAEPVLAALWELLGVARSATAPGPGAALLAEIDGCGGVDNWRAASGQPDWASEALRRRCGSGRLSPGNGFAGGVADRRLGDGDEYVAARRSPVAASIRSFGLGSAA